MTAEQIAVNSRALMAGAEKLTRAGFTGDAYRFVEGLVLAVIGDGWKPIEAAPAPSGPGSSAAARREAREAITAAIRDAKIKGGRQ